MTNKRTFLLYTFTKFALTPIYTEKGIKADETYVLGLIRLYRFDRCKSVLSISGYWL